VDLLKPILLLHAQQRRLPWYIASYLKITRPRPVGEGTLEAAPDLLVATAEDRLRTSWSIPTERKAPEFVPEVASGKSWTRDNNEKPLIYDRMGVQEYVLFAPERKDGPKLSGGRRSVTGEFAEWPVDKAGLLWSQALGGLGLYVEGGLWLRVLDAAGRRLPTPGELIIEERRQAEAARTARAEAERRAAAEAALAAAEAARAAAETELARVRAELRRLRGDET
jgi:hypothetical protein